MNTFFGSLWHRFDLSNKTHLVWFGAMLLVMIMLGILHRRCYEDEQKLRHWRTLCLLPLLMAIVHAAIYVFGFPLFIIGFFPIYLTALAALLPVPFAKHKTGYRIAAVITGLISFACAFYLVGMSPDYCNHTRESYSESFHSMVRDMDRNYVLKDWKEADLAALEEKYMPMVKEAEHEQDPAKFSDAVTLFCRELHDGHVVVVSNYDKEKYSSALEPREYGLAMVQLDDGSVIAVCTAEDVNKLGIGDGTVITKWNGKPVERALAEDVPDTGFSVKANEDRVAAIYLSGIGGDTVEVSYIDKSGAEQNAILTDLGEPHTQTEAFRLFCNFPKLGEEDEFEALQAENFSTKMLDDKCGYLRLTVEATDNGMYDIFVGYTTGDHKQAREMFREKLRGLKAQGMEYLVVDLRNNDGGYDEIGAALTDLFTDEEYYAQGLGVTINGKDVSVSDHPVRGDGEFSDLQVVALTNLGCLSAGDGTSLYLSRLPNVTLAGITDPYGCNQETGGISALSDGLVYVAYPVGLILDESGVPNIDTRADRVSRDPVEERIPFDYDAAMKMFRDKEDYELAWAVNYLEAND